MLLAAVSALARCPRPVAVAARLPVAALLGPHLPRSSSSALAVHHGQQLLQRADRIAVHVASTLLHQQIIFAHLLRAASAERWHCKVVANGRLDCMYSSSAITMLQI